MFDFLKKKKQVQDDDEETFVFSEFPDEKFEKNKKKGKKKDQESNTQPQGWVCGTPAVVFSKGNSVSEQGIPANVIEEVTCELENTLNVTRVGMTLEQFDKFWEGKKRLLKERGYDWKSPQDLNPYTHFD